MAKIKVPSIKNMPIKTEMEKPSVRFYEKDLPELKEWKVGNTYKIMVTVKQTETGIDEYSEQKGKMYGRFKILSVSSYNEHKKEKE